MSKPMIIARHELKQVLREPQFLIPYLLVPGITIGIYAFAVRGQGDLSEATASVAQMLVLVVGVLITSMTLVLCADSFAGEKERNSLEILLCCPISLRGLFLGKLMGILPIPIFLGWLGQTAVFMVAGGSGGLKLSIVNIWQLILLTPASALFLCSVAIFISLRMQTVRSAAQVSGLVVLFYLFLTQFISTWFFDLTLVGYLFPAALFILSAAILWTSSIRFERLLYLAK